MLFIETEHEAILNVNTYTLYNAHDTNNLICIMHKLLFCIIHRNGHLKRPNELLYVSAPKCMFDQKLLWSHKLREHH